MSENSQEFLKETVFRLLGCYQQQYEVFKELASLKNINGEENTKTLSDITEFGYLPLLNGNSIEVSGGKYGIDECVKRLINLSETGQKLTSVQKDELGTITSILNTIKSKGCFHIANLTQTLIEECPCHLEVWASLHKHGIVPLRFIIQMNQKNRDFASDFTKRILDFLKDSAGSDFLQEILSELINIGFVTVGESDKAKECTQTSISVLDGLIKDILHCILKNDDTNTTTAVEALCSLSVPVKVQKSFYSHVFTLIMSFKPEMKVSKAIREQCKWVYGKISESLIMLYKQILLVLDVPEIMNFVRQILEQHEVNWQLFLSFISVETVFTQESQKHLLDFTDNLLQEGLEDCDMETTITAMLITRQACYQGPHVFMSYADWFHRTFSDSSRSFANSRKSFTFLMKLLTDLAPYESAQHIKVHILRPPFVPGKCRQVLTDYIMLAKTRLQDLQEPLDAQNNGENKEQNNTSDLFAGEVSSAVEAFHTSGKIPTSILEASIFRKPYYIGQFLPVLLKPRPLPDMPDYKMKLIAALKKADKIPPNLYKSYEKECKKEAMQLIEGVFVDLDSDDDMELSPLEQLENSLQHLFALVNPGDLTVEKPRHTLKEVVSVIASKIEACIHDIPVNPIAQTPIEINIQDSSIPSNYIQAVDMILNRVSLTLKSVYSAGKFDCLWLTKLIKALIPYNKFTDSLFKRVFTLLAKQGCSLSEYHLDTLAAILVEIHLLKDQTPSIIQCGCRTGSDSLLEYVVHHMSIQTGNQMSAALRFVCSCLKYVYSSHVEETGFSNIPCLMKKFIYLSMRLVPECRNGYSESEQRQDGSDLQDIVLLLYQSKFVKPLAQNIQFQFKEWLECELQIEVRQDHLTDFERYDYYQWMIYQYYMMKTEIGYGSYREAASIIIKVLLTFDIKVCFACVKSNGVQLTNVGRGAVIGLVQQISDLTQLFKKTESQNDVLPWLPQHLMNLIESVDEDITKQNMVLNFTRLCLSLPPYLMFSDTSRNLATVTQQLKGSVNVINTILVTYLSEGALLPVSFTLYIAQGLLQAMKSSQYESGMKVIKKRCPALMMAFVVHYKAVSPFVDILLEENRSELQKFFTDLREDSYCITENHWLCSCSLFAQILFPASRHNFQEIYKETVINQSIITKVTEMLFIQSTYLQHFSQIMNKSQLTRINSALTTILDDRLEAGILDHVLQGTLHDTTRSCTNHHVIKLYPLTVLRFLKDEDKTNIGGHLNTEGLNGLLQSYVCFCKVFEQGSKKSKVVVPGDISQISEFLVHVIENTPADLLRTVNQDILMESGPLIYDAVLHQI